MKIPKDQKLNNLLGNLSGTALAMRKHLIFRMSLLLVLVVSTIVLVFAQTVAWKTNVVHTGGLMFSAEAWNFSAEVMVVGQQTPAAPGDRGTIEIKMKNDSNDFAVASVKVLKDQIIASMRNRMYFYVDTTVIRNGETVNGVYLNSRNSYTYAIFPHHELFLEAEMSHQPAIKWEWTYDNLGFYVYGKKNDAGTIEVEEYLQPVSYAYDPMRTTFDENGVIVTIDGQQSAEDFLISFSKNDGYEGQIAKNSVTPDGYYPVSFNPDTGYGVFAYLCNIDEINQGNENDIALGSNTDSLGQATVHVTGQNSAGDGSLVFNEETIAQVLSGNGLNVLTLNQDVELTKPIVLKDSSQTVIDLAGHKITSLADTVFDVKEGATLLLHNGEISGSGSAGISSKASHITLNDISLQGFNEGITIYDQKSSTEMDSVVHLSGCEISAAEDGILLYSNPNSDQKTVLIVEKSNIVGEKYAGIICNGSYAGSEIKIIDSTLKGKYTAVYFPQKDSTLTLASSKLEGYTGLVVKGGTVYVSDSEITGTGEYQALPQNPSDLPASGWFDTGDGIYLEANYNDRESKIYISGDKTKVSGSKEGTLAVRLYPQEQTEARIEISGGSFSTDVTSFVKAGYVAKESGGRYVVGKKEG